MSLKKTSILEPDLISIPITQVNSLNQDQSSRKNVQKRVIM